MSAVAIMGWLLFLRQVWPDAVDLVKDLYDRFHGDVDKTKAEIRRIRDHGARLDAAEQEIDARIEAVKAREKAGEADDDEKPPEGAA